MNKTTIAMMIMLALGLGACSSTKTTSNPGLDPGQVQALKDERLSTDFEREGVRIFYTTFGKIDRIEAYGYAEVWRRDFQIVAEADAKDKLVKFLRGETVSSQRITKVISRSIERSQDNTRNRFRTVDGVTNTRAEDIEREDATPATEENSQTNTALRRNSVNSAQQVTSTITVASKGRLTSVRKQSAGVVDDGRTYRAIYVWSPRDEEAARSIRNQMDAK